MEEEELPELDPADPLKRSPEEEDEDAQGADPVIVVPPEDGAGSMVSPIVC